MAYDKTRTGLIKHGLLKHGLKKRGLIKHVLTKTWIDKARKFSYPAKNPSRTILRVSQQCLEC